MSKTFTEDEFQAALADATAALEARITELEAAKTEQTIEAKVAEVRSEMEAKVAEVEAALDVAVAEAAAAKTENATILAFLEAEEAAKVEAEAAAAREDERVAAVKEVASFTDEHVATRSAEWAKMSDEDFDRLVSDLRAVAAKTTSEIPAATAMTAAAETKSTKGGASAVKGLSTLLKSGLDPRSL